MESVHNSSVSHDFISEVVSGSGRMPPDLVLTSIPSVLTCALADGIKIDRRAVIFLESSCTPDNTSFYYNMNETIHQFKKPHHQGTVIIDS